MPKFEEFYFLSSTKTNRIHVKLCIPDGKKRGIVQIAHGIAEHAERYGDFMNFLAENGFVAVANDHLGHGKTIERDEDKGFFAEKDGWTYVVDDMKLLHDAMKERFSGLPYIFFGHSMGSFLTRTYMIRYPDALDYAIISGTGQQGALMVSAGLVLAEREVKKNGPHGSGELMNKIAFGSYLKKIPAFRTEFDWLSRDFDAVDKYIADPLCGFVAQCSLYRDMMVGIKFITNAKNVALMNKDVPVYFMSGDCDPVGDYGAGVEKAYKSFCDAGMHDVTMRLYERGRHEMLNEKNKDDVYKDILNWLNAKVG